MAHFFLILFLIIPSLLFAQEESGKQINKETKEVNQAVQKGDSLDRQLDQKQSDLNAESDRIQQLITKYGKNKGRMVAAGRVWTGISPEMALDSWGDPMKKEKSVLNNLVTERWFYEGKKFLYFENGRLASWRE